MQKFSITSALLGLAFAIVAGSAFAEQAPLEVQLVYVQADQHSYMADAVLAAVPAEDAEALALDTGRMCRSSLGLHEGFVSQSAGATSSQALAAQGVLSTHVIV